MLNEKVVVVTGGAGLLGQTFIESIVENSGIAIIADLNDTQGLNVEENLSKEYPGRVHYLRLNITDAISITDALSVLHAKFGKIDALVNNAYPRNKRYGRDLMAVEYEDFCENINLNLGGCFLTSKLFMSYFADQGFGNIVNIASIYGVVAPKFSIYEGTQMTMPVEYAVIKSALIHLTKYFSVYARGKNIRVNSLSPGGIKNDQPEEFLNAYGSECLNKGMLDGIDIVGTLLYLLSDMSMYVNGQNIVVDDGFSL